MKIIYCEGVPGGPDISLLEMARESLGVDSIEFESVGSREAVGHMVQTGSLGIRDRDYLPNSLVNRYRGSPQTKSFPLSRHCIDSYLIDPEILQLLTGSEVKALHILEEEAQKLLWSSVARGVVEAYNSRHRRDLCVVQGWALTDAQDAEISLRQQLKALRADVTQIGSAFDAGAEVRAMAQDFADDGLIWTRVDGKELAKRVGNRVRPTPKGGYAKWALKQVEQGQADVPAALVADLQALLTARDQLS